MREKVVRFDSAKVEPRSLRQEKRLWHSSAVPTMPIGCGSCSDRALCGGLRVTEPIFDCTSYCRCRDPLKCDTVCRARPEHFVSRVSEVQGFDLESIPRCSAVKAPELSNYMPLIMHGSRRAVPLTIDAVAIPLGSLLDRRDGSRRFQSAVDLRDHFVLSQDTDIVVSGTAEDRSIERVWALEDPKAFAATLRGMRVSAFTSPNFSLFNDVPRWDNLYNMKRIALAWQQLQDAGLFSPLHVNARTDRDWERWTEFIERRPEVGAISFEYGTGAGWQSREGWYADKLLELGRSVTRPLQLFVRGGIDSLARFRAVFSGVKAIDSRPFMKAVNRQGGELDARGRVAWSPAPTAFDQELDDLLLLNIAVCRLDALQEARGR